MQEITFLVYIYKKSCIFQIYVYEPFDNCILQHVIMVNKLHLLF